MTVRGIQYIWSPSGTAINVSYICSFPHYPIKSFLLALCRWTKRPEVPRQDLTGTRGYHPRDDFRCHAIRTPRHCCCGSLPPPMWSQHWLTHGSCAIIPYGANPLYHIHASLHFLFNNLSINSWTLDFLHMLICSFSPVHHSRNYTHPLLPILSTANYLFQPIYPQHKDSYYLPLTGPFIHGYYPTSLT